MNTKDVALALDKIAEGFAALSIAIETPSAGLPSATAVQPEAKAGAVPPLPLAPAGNLPPSFEELPPEEMFAESINPQETRPVLSDAGLGYCPVHRKPWGIKAAGVSKAGQPYDAFYKCVERDGNTFCKEKPGHAWRDSHPIQSGAAA
jgi:hypothetical protein